MNREILFRGKRTDNGDWIEGYYCPCSLGSWPCKDCIIPKDGIDNGRWEPIEVDPDTVGQFTGLLDRNGKRIFEGDILLAKINARIILEDGTEDIAPAITCWSVEYKTHNASTGFFTYGIDRRWQRPITPSRVRNAHAVVCGNVYDNPEYMQGDKYKRILDSFYQTEQIKDQISDIDNWIMNNLPDNPDLLTH